MNFKCFTCAVYFQFPNQRDNFNSPFGPSRRDKATIPGASPSTPPVGEKDGSSSRRRSNSPLPVPARSDNDEIQKLKDELEAVKEQAQEVRTTIYPLPLPKKTIVAA